MQIFSSTAHTINVQKIFKVVLAKAFDLKVGPTSTLPLQLPLTPVFS